MAIISDQQLGILEWRKLGPLISHSSTTGNNPTDYQFWDGTGVVKGVSLRPTYALSDNNRLLWVTADDVDDVSAIGDLFASTEQLFVRAYYPNLVHGGEVSYGNPINGDWKAYYSSGWSEWDSFVITTTASFNTPPVASMPDLVVGINEWTQVDDWLSYSDAQGNPATYYQFWDGVGTFDSAYFSTFDNAHQPAGTAIWAGAADLDGVWIRGGQTAGTEPMWVRAYDGSAWGEWNQFQLTTTSSNTPPVATMPDLAIGANEWVRVADWLSYSDAQGDPATHYQFWDGVGTFDSAYFSTFDNAHQPAGTAIWAGAADLDDVWIRGGQITDTEPMWVRAYDGSAWGEWDEFQLTTTSSNTPPVAIMPDLVIGAKEWVRVADWLSYSDAQGDPATHYQFWDGVGTFDSAYFSTFDNVHQPAGTAIWAGAADLDDVWIHGGQTTDTEPMWVRAYDGSGWGEWSSFTVTTLEVKAQDLFDDHVGNGKLPVLASLSAAAYAAYDDDVWLPAGMMPLDIPGVTGGFYVDQVGSVVGNAIALVARTSDAIFLAFRGTDDGFWTGTDKLEWLARWNHYADFEPLISELDRYIASNAENIDKVYVTGHSLGAAMAQAFMEDHPGSLYEAITFASPGYGYGLNYPDDRISTIRIDWDPIFIPAGPSSLGGDLYYIDDIGNLKDDIIFLGNHGMELYQQVADYVDTKHIFPYPLLANNGIDDIEPIELRISQTESGFLIET